MIKFVSPKRRNSQTGKTSVIAPLLVAVFLLLILGGWYYLKQNPKDNVSEKPTVLAQPKDLGGKKTDDANDLSKISDWSKVRYDNPILKHCGTFGPCLEAVREVEEIKAFQFSRTSKHVLPSLQCHDWPACVDYFKSPVVDPPKKPKANVSSSICPAFEDLDKCCKDAENPAACRKCKRDIYHEKDECDPTPYDH